MYLVPTFDAAFEVSMWVQPPRETPDFEVDFVCGINLQKHFAKAATVTRVLREVVNRISTRTRHENGDPVVDPLDITEIGRIAAMHTTLPETSPTGHLAYISPDNGGVRVVELRADDSDEPRDAGVFYFYGPWSSTAVGHIFKALKSTEHPVPTP
ncbi:hypothetical protein [Embleya sp. NPDC059237]|uniref:hypothetical protein n=1 Tax=Embleya sp. NPDC059237 TaxID=3346784 RepID=UPI00367C5637